MMKPLRVHDYAAANAGYRWVILGIVCLTLISFAIVFQSIPPILRLIIEDLHLSHAEAGLLMSALALPGAALSIPAGMLTDRYGTKIMIVICLSVMIAGTLLVATGNSFPVLVLGRILAGAGGVPLFVICAKVISQWFSGRELGTAVGVYSTSMPVGTTLSLNTLPLVAEFGGWKSAIMATVAMGVLALVLFLAFFRTAPALKGETAPSRQVRPSTILKLGLPIWLVATTWLLFNASVISFLTFGPDFFVAQGHGIQLAGFLASFLMLFAIPLQPLFGYLLDRFDYGELFIGAGGLLIASGIFLLPSAGSWLVFLLVVMSVGNALTPVAVFAMPARMLKPQYQGTGYGIISTFSNIGVTVGPFLSGLTKDATGSYQLSLYLMSFFALLVACVAAALYVIQKGWQRPW